MGAVMPPTAAAAKLSKASVSTATKVGKAVDTVAPAPAPTAAAKPAASAHLLQTHSALSANAVGTNRLHCMLTAQTFASHHQLSGCAFSECDMACIKELLYILGIVPIAIPIPPCQHADPVLLLLSP